MRKTILYFITILFFNNPLAAEDITQISISGVKFGDSLLNYADPSLIKDTNVDYYTNDKYSTSRFSIQSDDFAYLEISYKTNDPNFTIVEISGFSLIDNISQCDTKKKNIFSQYTNLLSKVKKKEDRIKHPYDKSGKSIMFGETYHFKKDDRVQFSCTDWSKKVENEGYQDHFAFSVHRRDFIFWKNKNSKNM